MQFMKEINKICMWVCVKKKKMKMLTLQSGLNK